VRFFVNCGNNSNHPIANGALIRRMWHLAAPHATCFVQISSFVTLHGNGVLDRTRPNFGKRPWILDLYAAGKLLQESFLLSRREGPVVWLVHLPAVLGSGSNWTQIIAGAQRHGVAGFSDLEPQARPNFIGVEDLGRFLEEKAVNAAGSVPAPAVRTPRRFILSRPQAQHLTWMQFMGGMTDPAGPGRQAREVDAPVSLVNRFKNVARVLVMLMLGLGWRLGVLQWWEEMRNRSEAGFPRYDWPLPPPRPQPEEVVRFRGLTRHLLRTQPYLAELRD
jgi:hypothetical protein